MSAQPIRGGWLVCDMIDGYLVRHRYFDYTKAEALRLFKEEYKR